jgi:lipoyl(octanoyl) transferase
MKHVYFRDLGLKDYKETWDYQEIIFRETIDLKIKNRKEASTEKTKNYLLFCEHPHVYTLGKSGSEENMLLAEHMLLAQGATFHKLTAEEI